MGSTEENGGGGEMTLNRFLRLGSNWQPFQYVGDLRFLHSKVALDPVAT